MAVGTATVDFSTGLTETSVAVTGQAAITAASVVGVGLRREATASNTVDDMYIDPPEVWAGDIVPGTGFTIHARAQNSLAFGQYKIDWAWS